MGTLGRSLAGVEGVFKQGAEDGGVNVRPVAAGGFDEPVHAVGADGNGAGVGKNAAIESRNAAAERGRVAARVHFLPEGCQAIGNLLRILLDFQEQAGE